MYSSCPCLPPCPARHLPLFDRIITPAALSEAFHRVRAKKGGPGGDGVTIEQFEARIEKNLQSLHDDLRTGRYRPGRLRRVKIPKEPKRSDGHKGLRKLAIPPVRDRVAQTAAHLALLPALDELMSGASYAYRPGRSVEMAVTEVRLLMAGGHVFIVDIDIKKFFESIPHRRLIQELAIWCQDERFLALSALWLRSFSAWGRGVAQGAPISPLFANLYLHPVDRILAAAGIRAVRYADDILLLCLSQQQSTWAADFLESLIKGRGLSINKKKSRIFHAEQPFIFLGETLGGADIAAPPLITDAGA